LKHARHDKRFRTIFISSQQSGAAPHRDALHNPTSIQAPCDVLYAQHITEVRSHNPLHPPHHYFMMRHKILELSYPRLEKRVDEKSIIRKQLNLTLNPLSTLTTLSLGLSLTLRRFVGYDYHRCRRAWLSQHSNAEKHPLESCIDAELNQFATSCRRRYE
jgi:hypothetical protein